MHFLRYCCVVLLAGASFLDAFAAAIVPPSITAGFTNPKAAKSPLGTNLAQVEDFRSEYPFVDFMKMARPWFSGTGSTFDDGRSLKRDANGNVTSLLAGQQARSVIFTNTEAPDVALDKKRFQVDYDGDGRLEFDNVTVRSRGASEVNGSAVIEMRPVTGPGTDQTIILRLTRTNAGNPLRNVRMTPLGGICANNPTVTVAAAANCAGNNFKSFRSNHATILFNPAFLANLRNFHTVRFMDWMRTNNSTQSSFSTRALPAHQFWSTDKGVPLEVMVALSNLMDIDPWFNIPHKATDSYVNAFATLLYGQLEAGRRATIEYSNEVWNPIFDQTFYCQDKGVAAKLNGISNFDAMLKFYSRRARQVFERFDPAVNTALPSSARLSRIRRVMATQAVNESLTQTILGFENAASKVDAFAIAPYFGGSVSTQAHRDALLALGVDGVFDWLLTYTKDNYNDDPNDPLGGFDGSLPNVKEVVGYQQQVVASFRKQLISYEGGQHFLGAFEFQDDAQLNALFDAVNRDARMKNVYAQYLKDWKAVTGGEFNHYLNVDTFSLFGRWGSKEFQTSNCSAAPKCAALQAFITANPLP